MAVGNNKNKYWIIMIVNVHTDGTYMTVQLVKLKMKLVFVLLVTAIQCRLSMGDRRYGKFG